MRDRQERPAVLESRSARSAGDLPIPERSFRRIQESLHKLYLDANVPQDVRRRILEASVRAPQGWHRHAIRAAYGTRDEAWRLTAVFCMRFVRGFDEEILEALASPNPDIQYEAVIAAGNWGVDAAWPPIAVLAETSAPGGDRGSRRHPAARSARAPR